MRHRRLGRKLGRSPTHQKALLRSLATALMLTERDPEGLENAAKVKGRIITTLPKAKEVRPLVEKCITLACSGLAAMDAAAEFGTESERNSEAWKQWRTSERWRKWAAAMAPAVAARRKALRMLGDKQAVRILFDTVAPRFRTRAGGYTRILKLAKPRLGDAGDRAILEFVGRNDRTSTAAAAPSFEGAQS